MNRCKISVENYENENKNRNGCEWLDQLIYLRCKITNDTLS